MAEGAESGYKPLQAEITKTPKTSENKPQWTWQRPVVYKDLSQAFGSEFADATRIRGSTEFDAAEVEEAKKSLSHLGYDYDQIVKTQADSVTKIEFANGRSDLAIRRLYQPGLIVTMVVDERALTHGQSTARVDALFLQNSKREVINALDILPVDMQGVYFQLDAFNPRAQRLGHHTSTDTIFMPPLRPHEPSVSLEENYFYSDFQGDEALIYLHEAAHILLEHLGQKDRSAVPKEEEAKDLSLELLSLFRRLGFDLAPEPRDPVDSPERKYETALSSYRAAEWMKVLVPKVQVSPGK